MSKQKRTRRRFTAEFKAETVKRVKQSNRTMADVAMELGISAKSVGERVRLSEESGDSIFDDERGELRRLRKEVRELRMEKEILAEKNERSKKATDSQLAEDISD